MKRLGVICLRHLDISSTFFLSRWSCLRRADDKLPSFNKPANLFCHVFYVWKGSTISMGRKSYHNNKKHIYKDHSTMTYNAPDIRIHLRSAANISSTINCRRSWYVYFTVMLCIDAMDHKSYRYSHSYNVGCLLTCFGLIYIYLSQLSQHRC